MSYSSTILADSPLAYYRLGDASGATATDSSGNSRNGSYVNSPTLGVTGLIPGDADTAVTLTSASSQEVTSSSNAALSASNLMVEFVGKLTANNTWMRDHTSAAGTGWFLDCVGPNINIRISGSTYATGYAASNIKDGNAHHVVWGADGTTVYLYTDGVLRYSGSRGATTAPTLPWHLGRNGSTTPYVSGTFDEWAIYSSLSGSQVSAHYTAYAGSVTVTAPAATATAAMVPPTVAIISNISVTVPAATATATALPPLVGLELKIPVPAAAATAAALVPLVRLTSFFAPYDLDANSSQALQIPVTMNATLVASPLPVLPAVWTDAQVRTRRLSLVMPTPSLDSSGRPT